MSEKKNMTTSKENRNIFMVVIVILGAFIAALNQQLLNTALPHLMTYFNIDTNTAQWLTTAYMLTNGVVIPLTAALLEKFSTKNLFISALSVFGAGTAMCAFGTNFYVILGGRIIQAVGAGILMPLVNTVLLLSFPKEKRGTAMGLYGLVISFAPAIGPTLSGFIVDMIDWHWLFILMLPLVIVILILSVFSVENIIPNRNTGIDVPTIIFSALGFGALLYGFGNVGNMGWTNISVIITLVVGMVFSVLFVARQITMSRPMLELRVFKSVTFSLTTLIGGILTIAQVCATIMIPIFVQNVLGKTAFQSGLVLLPGAIIMAVVMLLSGRLYDKVGAKKLIIPGILLLIVSTIPFANLSMNTSLTTLTVFYAIRYLAIGLTIMPMQTAGVNALNDELIPHANAVVNTGKQIMGSIGTAVLVSVMTAVSALYAPDSSLSATNTALYQRESLLAAIKGMNVAFICAICVAVIALGIGLFIKEKKTTADIGNETE